MTINAHWLLRLGRIRFGNCPCYDIRMFGIGIGEGLSSISLNLYEFREVTE